MKNSILVRNGSTLFLKAVIILSNIPVLAFVILILHAVITDEDPGYFTPMQISVSISTLPVFFALYQTLKLLNYIDKNKAFSDLSVKALKYIKYCAIAFSALYAIGMPYIYYVAEEEDAPGLILFGLMFIFISVVAATFATVLQRILQDALNLKSENDLTV
jgi:hypothetical protein